MGLQIVASVINLLAGSAIQALALRPRVLDVTIADVAILVVELRDAILAAGTLRAVETTAAHHGGQTSDGDTIKLVMHNVVDALLKVWDGFYQALYQPFGNLSQKDTALRAGVKELGVRTPKQLLRQHVQHLVGQLRWGEHFVVAQVCQTRQYIGIIVQSVIHSQAVLDSQSVGIPVWADGQR